jgi:hypothetical protein
MKWDGLRKSAEILAKFVTDLNGYQIKISIIRREFTEEQKLVIVEQFQGVDFRLRR